MNEMPNGRSIRPSIPLRKKSGMNATMVMIVACTIEVRISVDASYTTFSDGRRSTFGSRKFSLSRLKTFSTSMKMCIRDSENVVQVVAVT